MSSNETFRAVVRTVSKYAGIPEAQLSDQTRLIPSDQMHPDLVETILESVEAEFGIAVPPITDWDEYVSRLASYRGAHASDVSRRLTRVPYLEIPELTIKSLCDIAEAGLWPREFAFPWERK